MEKSKLMSGAALNFDMKSSITAVSWAHRGLAGAKSSTIANDSKLNFNNAEANGMLLFVGDGYGYGFHVDPGCYLLEPPA